MEALAFIDALVAANCEPPCLLADGTMSLITTTRNGTHAGCQVPGADDITWVAIADLSATSRHAFRQNGGKTFPNNCTGPDGDRRQLLLCIDWAQRGGPLPEAYVA